MTGHAGHPPDTLPGQGRRLGGATRTAWFIVLAMMLGAAAWSISGQLIRWGMHPALAYCLSLMFDAAGLLCAQYARRAVERGTPAGLARLGLLAFVGVSAVINYGHGQYLGGATAAIGLSSIPCAVEALFELHRRDVRDEQRVARGLIAERLPHIPAVGWLMYPGESWRTLRRAVGVRLELLDPLQADRGRHDAPEPGERATGTVRAAVLAAAATLPEATPEAITVHLARIGVDTDPDTVRTILDGRPDADVRPLPAGGLSIADTVRTAVSSGVAEPDAVLAYVRRVHGPDVRATTVERTLRRITGKAG
jgi:hypothetical protein